MSKTLIEQFEPALIHRMLRLGANVDRFADGDEFGGFRFLHGGTPSEWRTNLHLALESLRELEARTGGSDEIEQVREIIYSILNAMRRSDNAALKRVLRYAVNRWPAPNLFEPPRASAAEDHLEQITAKAAEAYRDGSVR